LNPSIFNVSSGSLNKIWCPHFQGFDKEAEKTADSSILL